MTGDHVTIIAASGSAHQDQWGSGFGGRGGQSDPLTFAKLPLPVCSQQGAPPSQIFFFFFFTFIHRRERERERRKEPLSTARRSLQSLNRKWSVYSFFS